VEFGRVLVGLDVWRRSPRAAGRGLDGEQYAWTQLFVYEARDGRLTALCEFELDDEAAAAFAYAEERIRATEDND
jgi:hypothetical protein